VDSIIKCSLTIFNQSFFFLIKGEKEKEKEKEKECMVE